MKFRNYIALPLLIGSYSAANALTLEQSVATAMINNPKLMQKYATFESKHKLKRAAWGDYLPQVSLYAATGYENVNNRNGINVDTDLNRRELGLRVTQSLFEGFKTMSEVSRLDYEMKADKQSLISQAENIGLEITQVYIQLIKTQAIIEIAEENVIDHQKILADIQKRKNKGLSSDADVAQVQSRLATSQSGLRAAQNNHFDFKAKYYDLVGIQPEDLHIPQADEKYIPTNLAQAIELARNNHPEIKAASMDIKAANEQIEREKSDFWPKLALELDVNENENIGGFEGENDNARIMLTMQYNLYSGGKTKASAEAASWRHQEAKSIRDTTHNQVIEGTTLAWNAYQFIGEQKGFYRQNVNFATQAEEGYMQQFNIGRRSLLDVLDSKIELFLARKNYINASFDELTARYRLINSTGKLIEELRVDTPDAWQLKEKDKNEETQ